MQVLVIKFCGGLLFVLAMMFSGVKWNPANGKMGGFGCFCAAFLTVYLTFQQIDAGSFVPRLFYVYAAILAIGGLHIFFFPGNPKPSIPGANNHGNFSDTIAFVLVFGAVQCVFYPNILFQRFGPLQVIA